MSAHLATPPPARRRLVGGALRRYRENLGFDLDDAARVLECDRSKISRIETGQRGIRAKELRELLTEYGIDATIQDALAAIAQPRGTNGWWLAYEDSLPAACQDFLALEAAATQILAWEPRRVPGLLRTSAYALALASANPCADDAANQEAAALLAERQRAILHERHAEISVILAETALREPVAAPAVNRAQVAALADMASNSGHVTIHLLPADRGALAVSADPATILRFGAGLAAVHLSAAQGGTFLDQPADVAACTRAFEELKISAPTPAASARRLRELASW